MELFLITIWPGVTLISSIVSRGVDVFTFVNGLMNLLVKLVIFFVINAVWRLKMDFVRASLFKRSVPTRIFFCNDIVSIAKEERNRRGGREFNAYQRSILMFAFRVLMVVVFVSDMIELIFEFSHSDHSMQVLQVSEKLLIQERTTIDPSSYFNNIIEMTFLIHTR